MYKKISGINSVLIICFKRHFNRGDKTVSTQGRIHRCWKHTILATKGFPWLLVQPGLTKIYFKVCDRLLCNLGNGLWRRQSNNGHWLHHTPQWQQQRDSGEGNCCLLYEMNSRDFCMGLGKLFTLWCVILKQIYLMHILFQWVVNIINQ